MSVTGALASLNQGLKNSPNRGSRGTRPGEGGSEPVASSSPGKNSDLGGALFGEGVALSGVSGGGGHTACVTRYTTS